MIRMLLFMAGAGIVLLAANVVAPHGTPVQPGPALPSASAARMVYPGKAQTQIELPGGHKERVRSLLRVDRQMHFGDYEWNEDTVPDGPVWVRVDLAAQTISVFRAGHEIGTAVILYGTDGHPTPTGSFRIKQKEKDYWSRSYDAPMPYMLRLTDDGVAIHASDVTEGYATHGCVGVPIDFARRLFVTMKPGDPVFIVENRLARMPAVTVSPPARS